MLLERKRVRKKDKVAEGDKGGTKRNERESEEKEHGRHFVVLYTLL